MALQPCGKSQLEQRHLHCACPRAALPDDLVGADRRGAEQVRDIERAFVRFGRIVQPGTFIGLGIGRAGADWSRSVLPVILPSGPSNRSSSSAMSSADWTSTAPSRINSLHLREGLPGGEPCTAKTPSPASPASRAVMSEPERGVVSAATVPVGISASSSPHAVTSPCKAACKGSVCIVGAAGDHAVGAAAALRARQRAPVGCCIDRPR
jgi:hypothetical protein